MTCITARRLALAAAASLVFGTMAAPAKAQIPALLPTIDQMEVLEPLPIDGVWEIRELRENIVIENGHAYAEDGWVHMLLFRIQPDQVVLKNIRELASGDFVAHDLPAMAGVTLEWVDEDTLRGRTDGLIPVVYHLDRIDGFGGGFDPAPIEVLPEDLPQDLPLPDDDEEYVEPW